MGLFGKKKTPEEKLDVLYEKGMAAFDAGNHGRALELFEKAAEQGHANAQNNCGYMYENGYGVAKDAKKAFYWYEKAIEQGNVIAMNNLGNLYYNGSGMEVDMGKALLWFERAAERGNVVSQENCGYMYENGYGTVKDEKKSFYWYEKAAEQSDAFSQYKCGMMCEKGIGTQMDEEKALYWYEKAAEQGNAEAQCAYEKLREIRNCEEEAFRESMREISELMDMLDRGEQALYEEKYEEAISCYEWVLAHTDDEDYCDQASEGLAQAKERLEASDLSWLSASTEAEAPAEKPVNEMSDEEMYQKGMELYCAGDNKKALSLFEKAAEQGNADAQYRCCMMYKNGIGTEEDYVEAFYWLKKAAEQGQTDALRVLVEMADDYLAYNFWADNYEEAFSLYQKAAEQGHVEAQYICGQICDGQYFGTEIEPDLSQCVMWYEKAAEQGHEKSVEELKKWEKYVRMTPEQQYRAGNEAYDNEEYVLAFMLMKEAAKQDVDAADVFFSLGEMYRDGCGTKTDCEKAYFWWEKAARLGDAAAQYECGDACNYGDGVEKNEEKARMWYEKAAEQGHADAQLRCGEMYDKGEGTAVDKALY